MNRESPQLFYSWLFFNQKGEFHLLWLLFPFVILQVVLRYQTLPVIDVYWDSIFYKSLAWGLSDLSTYSLANHFPVPPLYPLLLKPAFWAGSIMQIEFWITVINALLYFSAIYPLYILSRHFLSPIYSAITCLIFCVYPASIFSQWVMSENLALPLTLWVMVFLLKELHPEQSSRLNAVVLGLLLCASILTRLQSIPFVIILMGWLLVRRRWLKLPLTNWLLSGVVATLMTVFFWWVFGYFHVPGDRVMYIENSFETVTDFWQMPLIFLHRVSIHLSALWIEGSFLIPALAMMQLAYCALFFKPEPGQREAAWALFVQALGILVTVALFRTVRADIEDWSVSLRHMFYVNILFLPLAVWAMGESKHTTPYDNRKRWLLFLGMLLVFAIGLILPESWKGFSHYTRYFTNAPSMDIFSQLESKDPEGGTVQLIVLAFVMGVLALWKRLIGVVIVVVFSAYIFGCSFDYLEEKRLDVIKHQHIDHIQVLARQLEKDRWHGYPVYYVNDGKNDYITPNLRYWVDVGSKALPEQPPDPPYLLMSFTAQDHGELVFISGDLRVYAIR